MKRIDKYLIQAESEQEFNAIGDSMLSAYFDTAFYLKYLQSKQGDGLFDLFVERAKILDHHNVLIDFQQIKKEFGINGKFATFDGNDIKTGSAKINTTCVTLSNSQANEICRDIYTHLLKTIVEFDGRLVS